MPFDLASLVPSDRIIRVVDEIEQRLADGRAVDRELIAELVQLARAEASHADHWRNYV